MQAGSPSTQDRAPGNFKLQELYLDRGWLFQDKPGGDILQAAPD